MNKKKILSRSVGDKSYINSNNHSILKSEDIISNLYTVMLHPKES